MSDKPAPTSPSRPRRLSTGAQFLAPLILIVSLVLFFFHKMAFSDLILARGDTLLYFYPYWDAASEAIRSGRIPLWNPDLFMGAPFLANSQAGLFYPLNWPLWWLLSAPAAVKASILLHLVIAGFGTYLAAHLALGLSRPASLFSGATFALGGYLTAQVEHVNQLQGLAWLPWFLIVLAKVGDKNRGSFSVRRALLSLSPLFTLQLLAGHSQTSFISIIFVFLWTVTSLSTSKAIWNRSNSALKSPPYRRYRRRVLFSLFLGLALALALSSAQLIPTLELSRLSSRQGGLPYNEVLSFSLPLLLLGRAMLPGYDQSLFSEYVAFVPITALAMGVLGAWHWRQRRGVLPAILLAVVGLLLALGSANPVYWILARIPPFNLFRAPARWLILYALGISLLSGVGWQVVWDKWRRGSRTRRKRSTRPAVIRGPTWRPLGLALGSILCLILWSVVAKMLAPLLPEVPESPYVWPSRLSILGWLVEILAVSFLLSPMRFSLRRFRNLRPGVIQRSSPSPYFLTGLALVVLFVSTRRLPYNRLTTPEAFGDIRPAVARIQALSECSSTAETCDLPPGRVLSLSDIFFDPGDQAEIRAIYEKQLSEEALFDYIVAIKLKEILAPNLPSVYGVSSVDGFDGGILPLRAYSDLMQLLLPEGANSTDGRLREHLTNVPEGRWLDLFNNAYLITDKAADLWREGVFFDLQHPQELRQGEMAAVGYLPNYEATALLIVAAGPLDTVLITTSEGQEWRLEPETKQDDLLQVLFPVPAAPKSISVGVTNDRGRGSSTIRGITLVDSRDDTFRSLVLGNYRMIHSGDVKVYENLDVLPRASVAHNWQVAEDSASAVATMEAPGFDPRKSIVIQGEMLRPEPASGGPERTPAIVEEYQPERVVIRTESDKEGVLELTDAFYPGWTVEVDGAPAKMLQVDTLFRGVFLSAGQHEVRFSFEPGSFQIGRVISLLGLLIWILLAFWPRVVQLIGRRVD